MDKGHKMTDKILEDTEKELNGIYKDAYTTAKQKSSEYLKKFAEKDAIMRKKVDDGEMTEDEYKQWRLGKMIGNSRYKAMAEGLARDMANTNKIAASVINGHLPDVYATNYNWGTYDIEQKSHMNTNFMMYDRQTVERLVRDKPDLLPMKAGVSIPEDMRWNKKQINNAITQGVLLGESIPDIAKRLASVTDMNRKSAIRNARTMTTSAENGGRIDSYKRAEEMGIKITQEWLATNDNRTRHEHMLLNGQEVKIGEPFKVEGYTIRYPADPQAEPFLVYNCRCCLVSNFKGFDYKKMDEYVEEKPMSYEQWEKKHEVAEPEEEKLARPNTPEGWAYNTAASYYGTKKKAIEDINNLVDNASRKMQTFWQQNAPKLKKFKTRNDSRAFFSHGDYCVHFNGTNVQKGDILHEPYQTHFHEYMHNIDYLNRKDGFEMFSDWWTDKDGRTLEDIIMGEWEKKFVIYHTDTEIAHNIFKEEILNGVSPKNFVSKQIDIWRRLEGIEENDDRYISLREQFNALKSSTDILLFYKEHTDEFITDAQRRMYGKEMDKNAIKSYIKDIREKYSLSERGSLSDMMQKFTVRELNMDRPLGAGHNIDYFNRKNQLSREAFAEFGDNSFANPAALEVVKKELPEAYAAYQQMIDDLLKNNSSKGGKKK